MSIPRLHAEGPLAPGVEIALTPAQAHHIGHVLRRAPGAALIAFNATEGEFAAELTALRKDRGAMRLGERLRAPAPEPELRALVAALKREAMDWAVEKATELGATRIQPVLTRRCVAGHSNTERLSAIARAAAEQCERLSIPAVMEARPLHAVLDAWDGAPLLVAAERREARPLHDILETLTAPCGFLVGPEGGFERAELDDLARRPFVSLATLGPRILRAETALVAGLGAISLALDARR
ncbi:16S rRNA (uracil(1498)-N(3))-methyltransferase [Roseococcus sp. SDR]|uniref:RsmE family RNA methyltransferase n=1 Tax=Roseococcus sp. SDR TaxID=2835532 RepID=UPI001BCBCD8C|nr:RsmE family RNA methyltransferase [Roseococcus sp. SDR]MBS7791960.1 16S rRNA (uracil(1498)-N(3))-methyltransferase [Roseococcus sp. SDR]MBV1847274.1 16S rRNA (uracil(1498)-N(3))-methyltransferase [Roseococcus sp. SDR]